jgi:hypothetical protein
VTTGTGVGAPANRFTVLSQVKEFARGAPVLPPLSHNHSYRTGEMLGLSTVNCGGFLILTCAVRRVNTTGDAGYSLLAYVQISLSVTKVLIRKRFRRLPFTQALTNLET